MARYQAVIEPARSPVHERVMVCVSSSRMAPRVIRLGARVAAQLGSRWYAVYVETPAERPWRINRGDADVLRRNLELAERLGATVVRVRAARPSDGLAAFARREGIRRVILGQTARSRLESLWHGSTLGRFLAAIPDALVLIVPLHEPESRRRAAAADPHHMHEPEREPMSSEIFYLHVAPRKHTAEGITLLVTLAVLFVLLVLLVGHPKPPAHSRDLTPAHASSVTDPR